MSILRVIPVALTAFAFAGAAWATGDPAAEAATNPAVPVKTDEITATLECDPALAGACLDGGVSATVEPAATPVLPKLPPEDSEG